jgi:hypothetical protein
MRGRGLTYPARLCLDDAVVQVRSTWQEPSGHRQRESVERMSKDADQRYQRGMGSQSVRASSGVEPHGALVATSTSARTLVRPARRSPSWPRRSPSQPRRSQPGCDLHALRRGPLRGMPYGSLRDVARRGVEGDSGRIGSPARPLPCGAATRTPTRAQKAREHGEKLDVTQVGLMTGSAVAAGPGLCALRAVVGPWLGLPFRDARAPRWCAAFRRHLVAGAAGARDRGERVPAVALGSSRAHSAGGRRSVVRGPVDLFHREKEQWRQ